ncbi:MAG: ABC transporter permease [Cyclobacteriaceae bacterium]
MFKNFIVLAYRHFIRSPLSSFIELFGMTAGLSVFLLVLLWVFHETGYDSFNEKADRIYRLDRIHTDGSISVRRLSVVAPLLKEHLPEVENSVRFRTMDNGHSHVSIVNNEGTKQYYEIGRSINTDNEFFDIFTFEFIAGNPKTALTKKNTAVITESLAKTIFGNENAIGKTLTDKYGKYTVTGVIKDVPNFHIPFKMLKSFESLTDHPEYIKFGGINSWSSQTHSTYLLINPNNNVGLLEKKIDDTIWGLLPEEFKTGLSRPDSEYLLRPLKEIYLNSDGIRDTNLVRHGDRKKIVAYTSIAFITLLLACINFINLNNAKYFERVKEVGIKKVCGASRVDVFIQFLGEVFLLCFVSLILALIFTHSLLPIFNEIVDTTLSIDQLFDQWSLVAMLIGLILISLTSGGFPALYISSFQPVAAIKGLSIKLGKSFNFKKANLVIQFSITIILLIGVFTAFRQVNFMKNTDLGFVKDKELMVVFDFGNRPSNEVALAKRNLLSNPNILKVSHVWVSGVPGENRSADQNPKQFTFDGVEHGLTATGGDEDYLETLGLEMLEGRFFEKTRAGDRWSDPLHTRNIILNETAVKAIGLENPIGTSGKFGILNIQVIGVVKDYHLNSVNNPILPTALFVFRTNFKMIAKISSNDIASTARYIETEVEKITGMNANVEFIDNIYNKQYSDDDNFARLISYFTALAILIACLGLLGVANHAIKLRIKEVGIRKIVGASSNQILNLLTIPFIKTISVSAVLAIPIGWIAMQSWLDNYPYRTDLPWWVFAVACGLTIAVAAFTIIWQSWRASSVNPARLIRYE